MHKHQQKTSLQYAELGILFFLWVIIFASPVFFQTGSGELQWTEVFNSWIRLIPFVLLMLVNHFILVPLLFFRKNKIGYVIIAFLVGLGFVLVLNTLDPFKTSPPPPETKRELREPHAYGNERERNPEMHKRPSVNHDPKRPPRRGAVPPYLNSILIAFLILGFGTGVRVIFRWINLEQEREVLEKQKMETELAFLRNQVSPHFFMNTLNNIHALIDIDSEDAKASIIKLSKLMRYLLYDSETGKSTIQKEIEFIKSYVDLMKLRFTEKVKISMSFPETNPELMIPPLLFISLVENAFKHGISYMDESFVDILMRIDGKELIFSVRNSKIKTGDTMEQQGGIGLDNLRKRLDILYENSYNLSRYEDDESFAITINLPIDA